MNPGTWSSSWRDGAWRSRWPVWRATLPGLLQRQMRRIFRRWVYAVTAFALGVAVVWLAHADDMDGLWHSEQALEDLRKQVSTPPAVSKGASEPVNPQHVSALVQVLDHLPGLSAQARLWPTLQQTLARQHLQLLSFRPVDEPVAAPLPSQAVALRLRGHFDDWVRAWSGMSEGNPVWSVERVHIHPQSDALIVEVDALLRVWLRAGPDGPRAWQGLGAAEASSAARAQMVFVSAQPGDQSFLTGQPPPEPVTATKATQPETKNSPDPGDWSSVDLRLLGTLQEAQTRYAILAFGAHWIRAQVGQRVSLEGHRLESIGDRSVNLRAGSGPALVLNFEQGPP